VLISAAKRVGFYVDVKTVPGVRYTIRSGESEVRWCANERTYYKIKDPFAKLHLKKHSAEYVLFEHVIHNLLFPDCRLEFLGVTEDCHEARLVFRQLGVRSDRRPTDAQIANAMSALGLRPDGRYSFGNSHLFVTDIGQDGDNVLLDDDGYLRFVDPLIGFKDSLCKLLDAYGLNPNRAEPEIVSKLFEM